MAYSTSSFSRLNFSDTDSYHISFQRDLSSIELFERQILLDNDAFIPFEESIPAYLLSRAFIKSIGPILDFSSILGPESYIEKAFLSNSKTLTAQAKILSVLTKNRPMLIKDETNAQPMKALIAGSCKQHICTVFTNTQSFPLCDGEYKVLTKKAKGLPRSRHNQVTLADYVSVCVNKNDARVIGTARIQRSAYRLYLTKGSKKCLGRFTVKRYLDSRHRTKSSFYSFPLNWKKILA